MKLSSFGKKMTQKTGILELMDDLGTAMGGKAKMLMLGGGNPAHIPEVETIWRKRWNDIAKNGKELESVLGNYTTPQGDTEFISVMVKFFNNEYGWGISNKNIIILNGSQTAFFYLFNLLAGDFGRNIKRKILLPLVPEYIGYADQGMTSDFFVAVKPEVNHIDSHIFKYGIQLKNIDITKDIAAICISRPTNPTGNVITDSELDFLRILAKKHDIPLIVDNAYGAPFPNILFTNITPVWDENIISVMSLSKIGLPGVRTSIVVAREEIVSYLVSINAIASLATGTIGQHLIKPLIEGGKMLEIGNKIIKPFYYEKLQFSMDFINKSMKGSAIPYYLHKAEGAMFLWLWCKDLPVTSYELYQRLKSRGVLVVPGQYFFPGLQEKWKHKGECLRITYSQDKKDVESGLKVITEEIKRVYA